MIELYSVKETAKIFGLKPSQLRYWTQTGFVSPTVRRGGRLFYTFRDLVGVKAAKELLASGIPMAKARPSLEALRRDLPQAVHPTMPLTICSDGSQLEISREDDPASTNDVVVAFRLSTLASHIAEVLKRPHTAKPKPQDEARATVVELRSVPKTTSTAGDTGQEGAVPKSVAGSNTEPHAQPSAYECFRTGYTSERGGELETAEAWYLRALSQEPSLAAAHTNLGNVLYERGEHQRARQAYETALDYDPDQPEARYNLGNLLDEIGETELAIAELRQVVSRHPEFADAHYNLGLVLYRVGGQAQARAHLTRYLELDGDSEWSSRARAFLADTN